MTHKPKLIGVTGFARGAGVSTLAAGLAAAFSEMGDGKVLLVDANLGCGEVHPFLKGRPAGSLMNPLHVAGEIAPAADNLYLATVAPQSDSPTPLGLKEILRSSAEPKGERLRLHYFRYASSRPNQPDSGNGRVYG